MKPYLLLILLLVLLASCQRDDFSGMEITEGRKTEVQAEQETENGDEASSTLASSVIGELQSNLSSTRSTGRVLFQYRDSISGRMISQRVLTNHLTVHQIQQITDACTNAVTLSGLSNSSDLIQLMPEIIEASQKKLSNIGMSDSSEIIQVINVIVYSMVKSLHGRDDYLNSASSENGLTAKETMLKAISSSSVAHLDGAGLDADASLNASEQLVGSIVSTLDDAGVSASELSGITRRVTSGAIDALDQVTGLEPTDLGKAVKNITAGVIGAVDEISIQGYSSDNLSSMVESITAGATVALGDISISGYSSDNLSSLVNQITSGATGALDQITMEGYDSSSLSTMVNKITRGATKSIGLISMDGYDASHLEGMVEQITAGATSALDEIEMQGYSSDNLSALLGEISSGATSALGEIKIKDYSSDNLTSLVNSVTKGSTGALDEISMNGFDKSKLGAMVEQIASGATESLDQISMDGYDSSHLSDLVREVTAGATEGLGKISMEDYSADDLGDLVSNIASGATGALGKISMEGYDSNDLNRMVTQITAGSTEALDRIGIEGLDKDDLKTRIKSGTSDSLGKISGMDTHNININSLDLDPPTIIDLYPPDGSTNIPVNTTITATFSEPMDNQSLNKNNFKLYRGTERIEGSVIYVSDTAKLTPEANLAHDVLYTVKINTKVRDLTGNPIENKQWFFSTIIFDDVLPIISLISKVPMFTNNQSPDVVITSNENGQVQFFGACSSSINSIKEGSNTLNLNQMSDGTYTDCRIKINDESGNVSNEITLDAFTIDTVSPVVTSVIVNLGDNTTDRRSIPLKITGSDSNGIDGWLFSESIELPKLNDNWTEILPTTESLDKTYYINLSDDAEEKTINVWLKDVAGNISNRTNEIINRITHTASAISSGGKNTCAVSNGSVYCWPILKRISNILNADSVSIGQEHFCALLNNGKVVCWGSGTEGQLGHGQFENSEEPVTVQGLDNVTQIASGDWHSCALLDGGLVKCWGNGGNGRLGDNSSVNSSVPVSVKNLSDVTYIAAGLTQSCAILKDQTVKCWGNGFSGQLGYGDYVSGITNPVSVVGIDNAIMITAGNYHTCSLLSDKTIKCWGSGNYGQVGHGEFNDRILIPVKVLNINNAISVEADGDHTCALLENQTLMCWGFNNVGQLGSPNSNNQNIPTSVTEINTASDLSLGAYHTCAVLTGGLIKCWGSGILGKQFIEGFDQALVVGIWDESLWDYAIYDN